MGLEIVVLSLGTRPSIEKEGLINGLGRSVHCADYAGTLQVGF